MVGPGNRDVRGTMTERSAGRKVIVGRGKLTEHAWEGWMRMICRIGGAARILITQKFSHLKSQVTGQGSAAAETRWSCAEEPVITADSTAQRWAFIWNKE